MKSRTDFFQALVETWTKEQCIAYLSSRSLELLQDDCLANLECEFDDCETENDVREVAKMDWLSAPK